MKAKAKPAAPARLGAGTESSEVSPLLTLQNLINQDFERFFSKFGISAPSFGNTAFANLNPSVNVTEKDNVLNVDVELPGLTEKDVTVALDNNVLTIHGQRRQESDKKEGQVHRREIRYGSFRRNIALPGEADASKAEATFKSGILHISIPVTPRRLDTARQIPIVGG